jgi:hypothetical protein
MNMDSLVGGVDTKFAIYDTLITRASNEIIFNYDLTDDIYLENVTFYNFDPEARGGVLYTADLKLTIVDCVFRKLHCRSCALFSGNDLVMNNTIFEDITAKRGFVVAIFSDEASYTTSAFIFNCTFKNFVVVGEDEELSRQSYVLNDANTTRVMNCLFISDQGFSDYFILVTQHL